MTTTTTTAFNLANAAGVAPIPFTFQAVSEDEIGVERAGILQTKDVDYTVTLNGDSTGSITPLTTWGADPVTIYSNPDMTQPANFTRFGSFFPDQFDPPLDRLARQAIYLKGETDRAVKAPHGTSPIAYEEFIGGIQGDPGANVMAVGPFATIPAQTIPAGTEIIRTSKYAGADDAGLGAAEYEASPLVNAPYVAQFPRLSSIDLAGRGFRHHGHAINLEEAGGKGNSTAIGLGTDNFGLYEEIDDYLYNRGGGRILVPYGRFRMTGNIKHRNLVQVEGVGWSENAGRIGAWTTANYFDTYTGSVLVFDADVPGILFTASNEYASAAAAAAAIGPNPELVYAYPNSRGASISNLLLLGGGGANRNAHGLDVRSRVSVFNVGSRYFAGDGMRFQGSSSTRVTPYGNISHAEVKSCSTRFNMGHGLWVEGNESSLFKADNHDSALNGGFGFVSKGFAGEHYLNCHAASNNLSAPGAPAVLVGQATHRAALVAEVPALNTSTVPAAAPQTPPAVGYVGSFYCDATGNKYESCYTENGWGEKAHSAASCLVDGGTLDQRPNWTSTSVVKTNQPVAAAPLQSIKLGGMGAGPEINIDTLANIADPHTWRVGDTRRVSAPAANAPDHWLCVGAGTNNKALVGVTATSVAGSPIISVTSVYNIVPGEFLSLGGGPIGEVIAVNTAGLTVTMSANVPYSTTNPLSYQPAVLELRGGRSTALADTATGTAAGVEAALNALKAAMRVAGLLAP